MQMTDRWKDWIILFLAVTTAVAVTGWYRSESILSLEAIIRVQNTKIAAVAQLVRSVKWPQRHAQQFKRLGIDAPQMPMKQQPETLPEKEGATNGNK